MRTMKHWALAVSAAAALALAGCGGGGGGTASAPAERDAVSMPADTPSEYAAAAGTYEIAAGGTMDVNGVRFSCAASACTVYVGNDGTVTSRGGMVTAAHTPLLAALIESQAAHAAAQAALDAANDDLTSTQADLDTANANLMATQTALDTANDDLMATQTALDTANDDLMATQTALDTANDDLMARQTALDDAQAEVDRLVASGDATQEELDTANANLMTAQGELTAAQGEVTRLSGELMTANDNVTRLDGELAAATGNVTRLEGELATATGNVTRLEGELATATGNVTRLEGELATANAEIGRLQGLLDTARQVPLRLAIEKAIADLTSAVAEVDASSDADEVKAAEDALAAARKAIADAVATQHLPPEETDAETADVNTIAGRLTYAKMARTTSLAAATKETAIAAERDQTTDAGLGGSEENGDATTNLSMTVKRPRSGLEIEFADTDLAADDDPEFMLAMNLGVRDGHTSTMHTRMMEADDDDNVVEEVVIVTTDIDAPDATPFGEVYTLNVSTDTDNDSPTVTNEALTIDGSDMDVLGRVMSNSFVPNMDAETTMLTFDADEAGMTGDQADEVGGTYAEAMGTYRCNGGTDCTVTLDDEGTITEMSAGWIFTPDTGVRVDVQDDDFLHYGFWLRRTTDEDGVLTYNEVETFAVSSVTATGSTSAVLGTATYEGGATGVYVHTVDNPDGTRNKATSGHFTADASLTANFGGNDVAVSMQQTLTGTIDSFRLSGGEANSWSVALESAASSDDGTHSGTAMGGLRGEDGSFNSTFHGPNVDADSDPIAPHTVVGEFNADFTNGSVAGAFGARKTD